MIPRRGARAAALMGLASMLWSPLHAAAQTATPSGLANPLAAQSLDGLSATRERPLFAPSRRSAPPPAPVAPAPVAESAAEPPHIALLGIIIAVDGPRAWVNDISTNKIMKVRIGDDIDGWKVGQIHERRLVLWRDGRSATFSLFNGEHRKSSAAQILNAANKSPEDGQRPSHRRRLE